MYVVKLRSKRNNGKMPQGYVFDVLFKSGGTPNSSEIKEAAERVGLPISYSSLSDFEVVK